MISVASLSHLSKSNKKSILKSMYSLSTAMLMFAMPLEARPLAKQLFAGVNTTYERLFRNYKWAETAKQIEHAIHEFHTIRPEKIAVRRLTEGCDYVTDIQALLGKECGGDTLPVPLYNNDTVFETFCTSTCGPKIQEIVAAWLQKPECKNDRSSVRLMGEWCTQGSFGGETGYCLGESKFNMFQANSAALSSWSPDFNVGPYCAADSCTPKLIHAFVKDSSAVVKKSWDMILKYMCTKPDQSTTTCWKDFAAMMKSMSSDNADPTSELMNSPATFCPNKCKRSALMDVMGVSSDTQATQTIAMLRPLFQFACLQKEDSTYCITLIQDKVAVSNTLNYDGTTVTRKPCEESHDSGSSNCVSSGGACVHINHKNDKPGFYSCDCVQECDHCFHDGECVRDAACPSMDGQENPNADEDDGKMKCGGTDGICAPWCRHEGQYPCTSSGGMCEDFLDCDTTKGEYQKYSCSCTAQIGQLMSFAGCCLAASIDYTCSVLKSGTMPYANSIDITMCDEDPVATQAKGFEMSKAMARAESCGLKADPRCTHGQPVKVLNFDLTFNNVDTQTVCADKATPTVKLIDTVAESLSVPSADVTIDLCSSTSRRLASTDTLTSKVEVEESGQTDLGLTKSLKEKEEASGTLSSNIEDKNHGLTAVTGKSVTVKSIGAHSESTKSGVAGSTSQEITQLALAAGVGSKTQEVDGAASLSLSAVLLAAVVSSMK